MEFTNEQINEFIQKNQAELIKNLGQLVAIPSVEGVPEEWKPFGKEPARALDKALEIASSFGLDVDNGEWYVGFADVAGISEKIIATITHVDVVPQGNGWTQDPYEMKEKDGYLIGRGVMDDKGAAIVTLYVAKFFKELGQPLPYTLRIILGANEETGMADVDYYNEYLEEPVFCMTPDGNFPVCYGEKGIFSGDFVTRFKTDKIVDFAGGVASNVIPDRAFVKIKTDIAKLQSTKTVLATDEKGIVTLSATGVGGHAAHPEGTVNAIGELVKYILDNDLLDGQEQKLMLMLSRLFADTNGAKLGIASDDGMFTPLTCIGGMVKCDDGQLTFNINIRFPTTTTAEGITKVLKELADSAGADFVPGEGSMPPFVIDPKSEVIQTLVQVYNEVTGKKTQPFTMGGGTYARHFKNAVSFGIEEQDAQYPSFVGPMHGADEGVPIELLLKTLKIYIIAIGRLMELKF